MSARFYSDEYMYWTKASVGLQRTKEGLCTFVKHKMQMFITQFQSNDDHFTRFLESMMDKNRVICNYKLKHTAETTCTYFSDCDSNKCSLCENMFNKVLEIHSRKNSRRINWTTHDTKGIKPRIHWWIVAKFYISDKKDKNDRINDKIKRSTGPEEVDVLKLLELLAHCELFENIKCLALEVIEVRNKLMHNAKNEISKAEMIESFSKMKALFYEKDVQETSSNQLRILEELDQTDMHLIKTKWNDHEMIAQALKLKKKAIKHDISAATRNDASSTTELEDLKELEEMLTATNQAICTEKRNMDKEYNSKKDEIERLSRELSDLEKMNEEEKRKTERLKCVNASLVNQLADARMNISTKDTTISNLRAELLKATGIDIGRSVTTGAAYGGTVGAFAGPIGAAVGASLGGAIGGTSEALKKIWSG